MRKFIIIVVIVGCVLGYGYWHSSTHASFYVQLVFRDRDTVKPKTIPKAKIQFLDAEGHVLANGISDVQYNYVHLIHPEVGDCHEVEKSASSSKKARESWRECFEARSTWIPKWVEKVRQINLKTQNCNLKNVPVTVSKYHSDWFLWWVPLPHIGGKPYSYYSLSIAIQDKNCLR
jgi:hypothetical protein